MVRLLGSRRFSDEQILEAWEEVKKGKTVRAVARSMGYAYGIRLSERLRRLIPEGEYRKYVRYTKRRSAEKRNADIKKEIELFDQGFTQREIAKMLGLTYNQVNDDLTQNYPDKIIWRILCQNSRISGKFLKIATRERRKYRLTKNDVLRAKKLLEKLGVMTVANILGIPYHRLTILPEAKRRASIRHTGNMNSLALVGEWLLGRYLQQRFPNKKWHIRENIRGTDLSPDFWSEDAFWDSKARFYERHVHRQYVKNQLKHYLQHFQTGYVVYWFGLPINAEPILPNLYLIDGKDLAKRVDNSLKRDISSFLNGDYIPLLRKLFGFD